MASPNEGNERTTENAKLSLESTEKPSTRYLTKLAVQKRSLRQELEAATSHGGSDCGRVIEGKNLSPPEDIESEKSTRQPTVSLLTGMTVEKQLNDLADTMKVVPENMRMFSLCMRSLYADKALGGSSDTAKKMNKIRDDTREDALIYVKGILPASTGLVRTLKEFFEYYEELGLEEWKENLPDILEEVRGYRQCCVEIIEMHEQIMIPLKKRQDEAKVLIAELNILTKELERKKAELEESASNKRTWATWLFFVPGVNVIATPLLTMSADTDLVRSVANSAQCGINNAAVLVVSKTMIPALSAFIMGLESIAGFFKVVEEEITTFQNKGEKASENPKKMHYTMMKSKSKEIKQSCKEFFAMIPGVRTDFLCIPQSGSDKNYVDKWLKKQQEEIKKKYEKSITGQLMKMLTHLSIDEGKMIKGKE